MELESSIRQHIVNTRMNIARSFIANDIHNIQPMIDLEKGAKVPIGTVSGKYKKVAEGKWVLNTDKKSHESNDDATTDKKSKEVLEDVYASNGLNGLHNYLKKNEIPYKAETMEFGLHTSKKARQEKFDFLHENTPENVLHLHYYSLGGAKAKNGYEYNRIRGLKITIGDT